MSNNNPRGGLWSQALQKAISKTKHPGTGQPPLGSVPTGPLIAPLPGKSLLGAQGAVGVQGPPVQSGPANPSNTEPRKKSDDRFRSFAERYVLTRSHLWPEDPEEWQKAMYAAVLDARVAYNTIKTVGFNAEHDGQ